MKLILFALLMPIAALPQCPNSGYYLSCSGVKMMTLSGSEVNVDYQLFRKGPYDTQFLYIDDTKSGTGNTLTWSNDMIGVGGTFKVRGVTALCSIDMDELVLPVGYQTVITGCAGSNAQLSLSSSEYGVSYWLKLNGSIISGSTMTGTGSGLSWTINTSGTYVLTADVGGPNSCAQDIFSGVLEAPPSIPTISTSGSTSFCPSGFVTLTSSLASSYLWSTGETTQSINVSETASVTVTTSNVNGCTATSQAIEITEYPKPSVSISGPSSFCGSSATLQATGANSYNWVGGPNNSSTKTVSSSGTYYVTGYNAYGCASDLVSKYIDVYPNITVSISKSGNYCPSGYVTLTANAPSGSSYYWYHNGATTASTSANAGNKTVLVTKNGCSATKSYYVAYQNCGGGGGGGGGMPRVGADNTELISTPEPKLNLLSGIYPNPVENQLNVVLDEPAKGFSKIELMDQSGKIFITKTLEEGETESTLATKHIPNGLYILTISTDKRKKYIRVIIKH